MKYLERVYQDMLRQAKEQSSVTVAGRIPEGWTREGLEAYITELHKDRLVLRFSLVTQISILSTAYGLSETTGEALRGVGLRLNENPNASPEDFRWKPRLWQMTPPGFTDGERMLHTSQKYAQEMFELYKSKIQPELINSRP